MSIEATDTTFDTIVLQSDKPVLVDFWAPWCGPCRAVSPILDQIAEEYGDKITVVKVNVDENPTTSNRYEITSIPALKVFQDGVPVKSMVGAKPKPVLLSELSNFLLT